MVPKGPLPIAAGSFGTVSCTVSAIAPVAEPSATAAKIAKPIANFRKNGGIGGTSFQARNVFTRLKETTNTQGFPHKRLEGMAIRLSGIDDLPLNQAVSRGYGKKRR